jgi:aryl-alcohol dehydrogenase-like predicted oxidoreductase
MLTIRDAEQTVENWAADAIEASVERSAGRMNLDHVDIVVLHNPPAEILAGGEHYDVALRAALVEEFRALLPAGIGLVAAALRFLPGECGC